MGRHRVLGWMVALGAVLLLCGSGACLVGPATVRAVDPAQSVTPGPQEEETEPSSGIEDLYAALRPEGLRTDSGETEFERGGSAVHFTYDLVNRSSAAVTLPYLEYGDTWFYLAGAEQTWIERLGPHPAISCMPWAGRKGTWYAAGGQILAAGEPVALGPGESLVRHVRLPASSTACFKAGAYRYHIEYKPLNGGLEDVIAEVTIDLTFERDGDAAPTPRPGNGHRSPKPTLPPTSTLDAHASPSTDRFATGLLAAVAGILLATAAGRRRAVGRPRC